MRFAKSGEILVSLKNTNKHKLYNSYLMVMLYDYMWVTIDSHARGRVAEIIYLPCHTRLWLQGVQSSFWPSLLQACCVFLKNNPATESWSIIFELKAKFKSVSIYQRFRSRALLMWGSIKNCLDILQLLNHCVLY